MQNKTLQKDVFEYKWVIATVCFLAVFAGLGFCSSAKSIYISPITNALGFSRSAFSINDSCRYVTTAVASIFFDSLMKKFGTKKLIGAGLFCYIISSLLYSVATKLITFYLGGIFLGLGVAWTTTTMVGVVINKWFTNYKGAVLGAVLASNGLGAAVAIHFLTPVVYEPGNPFGYRKAYLLTVFVLILITIFVMVFYKESPSAESIKTEKEDISIQKKNNSTWKGFEYSDLIKKPAFYCIIICIFIRMLSGGGMIVTPHLTDIGLDPEFVSSALGVQLILLAVFKLLVGIVFDRFGVKTSFNICMIFGLIGTILLLLITNSALGRTLTIIYSILSALAAPIETVLLPLLALSLFGEMSFNKTLGILTAVSTAGQALGMPVMSLAYDVWHSYAKAFICSAAASFVIILVMNIAINFLLRDRRNSEE